LRQPLGRDRRFAIERRPIRLKPCPFFLLPIPLRTQHSRLRLQFRPFL